ncbi:MAG: threonine ammonia-lyase [Candidatus Helarchaeota archaeon]
MEIVEEIRKVNEKISKFCKKTPLIYSTTFSEITGNEIYLKLENFQKTGSFKIRGAINKILKIDKSDIKGGIITVSTGNHGQAVAYASKLMGYECYVVLPEGTPINKILAIEKYGARIVMFGKTFDEAYKEAMRIKEHKNLIFIPAYNDYDIIYGQGTIGLEIFEQCPDVEIIVVPIGGGGLISGISSYCKNINPNLVIIGVQSEVYSSMYESLKIKRLEYIEAKGLTIADGIAVKKPGDLTFPIINKYVNEILLVNDDQIAKSILLLMERAKLVVEGAGAVGLAAIMNLDYFNQFKNKKIVCVISGGNIDVNLINRIIIRGLKESGRLLKFSTKLLDTPGSLLNVLEILKRNEANIISINHNRSKLNIPFKEAEVEIEVETRNSEHIKRILEALSKYDLNLID